MLAPFIFLAYSATLLARMKLKLVNVFVLRNPLVGLQSGSSSSRTSFLYGFLGRKPSYFQHLFQEIRKSMVTGTVKWFNESKGYGFITPDSGGDDLFAHFSAIQARGFKTLRENQKVSFDVTTGPKGKPATNITPIE